jgi:hypothetical protein
MNPMDMKTRRDEYAARITNPSATDLYAIPGALTLKLVKGGVLKDDDYIKLNQSLVPINERNDCADFHLGFLIRMFKLCGNKLSDDYREKLKSAILNFRYWSDEDGHDSMWFWSENHRILFHSAQMLAGLLFPTDTFSASKRLGQEQSEIAKERIKVWMSQIEKYGFDEFQSSDYQTVTLLGMLNVLDFCDDSDIRWRMNKLITQMFQRSLLMSFDGQCSGPQGRIYCKSAVNAETTGKQGVVSLLSSKMRASYGLWTSALLTSSYHIPDCCDSLAVCDVDTVWKDGGALVKIERTKDYFISSMILPSPVKDNVHGIPIYMPGKYMAQQHLWEATLGSRARVFVNHPGAANEFSNNRPGYWGGNGIAPRLEKNKGEIVETFDIPETYPIHFTHAYFPVNEFDHVVNEKHWIFAQRGNGLIALWCSLPIVKYRSAYINKEFRAYGSHVTWICRVSSIDREKSIDGFMNRMKRDISEYKVIQ